MEYYQELAREMLHALDQKSKSPPAKEIGAAVRGEMAVLRLLKNAGEAMTAGEVSRMLGMTTSRIAAVLGSLEKKGLILRRADARDKRRVLVELTQEGSAQCERRRQEALEHMTQMLAYLGKEDAAHFVRIMKRTHEFIMTQPSFGCENRGEELADE